MRITAINGDRFADSGLGIVARLAACGSLLVCVACLSGPATADLFWQYGFSRRTFAMLKAFHQQREVWSVNFVRGANMRSTSGFFKLVLPVNE